jgi:hypothetical protein
MTVPEGSLRAGLHYVTGAVSEGAAVYVIDVGRDVVHSAPLLLTTWAADPGERDGSFAEAVFDPEHLVHEYTPPENVRVAYDHGLTPSGGDRIGEWSGVPFRSVEADLRRRFREANRESYTPDEAALDQLRAMLD